MEKESLLEAALSESFTPPPSRRQSRIAPATTSATKIEDVPADPTPAEVYSAAEGSSEDDWKHEYEEQVKAWRVQSAEAREKAEKERAKWEAVREAERSEGAPPPPPFKEPLWQKPPPAAPLSGSPSPADVRDLVTGEQSKNTPAPPASSTSHSRQLTDSQKWENIPSEITSSLPSMTFPEDGQDTPEARSAAQHPPAPTSATLSVFDSTLSHSTRFKALASALAINLILPFVNGVMLGFGEIFAKNVVLGWFGWKPDVPGSTAASLGLRKSRR